MKKINVSGIVPCKFWPRRYATIDQLSLVRLSSIRDGFHEEKAIRVIPYKGNEDLAILDHPFFFCSDEPEYIVFAGHCRTIASKMFGLEEIPANVTDAKNLHEKINDTGNMHLTKGQGSLLIANWIREILKPTEYGKKIAVEVCKRYLSILFEMAAPSLSKAKKAEVEEADAMITASESVTDPKAGQALLEKGVVKRAAVYTDYYYGRLQEIMPLAFLPASLVKTMVLFFDGTIKRDELPAELFWDAEKGEAIPVKTVLERLAKAKLLDPDYVIPAGDFFDDPNGFTGKRIKDYQEAKEEKKASMLKAKDIEELIQIVTNSTVRSCLEAVLSGDKAAIVKL
jgi:hypothetical protein